MKLFKILKWFILISIVIVIAIIFIANEVVENSTEEHVYSNIQSVPYNKVGIVLGTSKYLRGGGINLYYKNRLKAAEKLFNAGKIDYIVISGDNSSRYYNEPQEMKNDLVDWWGIPDSIIVLDYAGFRTYDSVIRLNKIFGQKEFTVISQEFQNRRAIYIARQNDLEAIGYNAEDVNVYGGFMTNLREKFARVKLFLDLFFETKPKFLGEKIKIGE